MWPPRAGFTSRLLGGEASGVLTFLPGRAGSAATTTVGRYLIGQSWGCVGGAWERQTGTERCLNLRAEACDHEGTPAQSRVSDSGVTIGCWPLGCRGLSPKAQSQADGEDGRVCDTPELGPRLPHQLVLWFCGSRTLGALSRAVRGWNSSEEGLPGRDQERWHQRPSEESRGHLGAAPTSLSPPSLSQWFCSGSPGPFQRSLSTSCLSKSQMGCLCFFHWLTWTCCNH